MTDILRSRGDTYPDLTRVRDGETGDVVDISSGYSFILTVDPSVDPTSDSTKLFSIVGVISDGPGGIVGFSPSVSNADNLGDFFYDIQMIDSAGDKTTLDKGAYSFVQDITKD